jgi:hypothetical protein
MRNVFLILVILFAVGCMSDHKEHGKSVLYDEAALKDFVFTTADPDKDKSVRVMDTMLTDASTDSTVFCKTVAYMEKWLGDPNSIYRNEDLYAALLQAKMKSSWTDSIAKISTRERLYLLMQNRVGSMANDFVYTTPSGAKKKMYELKAEFTLLFFYNPECQACKEMKAALMTSEVINAKVNPSASSGPKLKVLAVYTDKDELIWLDHLKELPDTWVHGRDEEVHLYKDKLYDLRAIPTVYLLDKEKKVLLKDCMNIQEIEKAL